MQNTDLKTGIQEIFTGPEYSYGWVLYTVCGHTLHVIIMPDYKLQISDNKLRITPTYTIVRRIGLLYLNNVV